MAKDQAPNTVAALELIDISAAGGPTVVINGARTVDVIGFGVSDIIIDVAIHCRKAMQRGDGALRVHLLTTFKTLSGKSRLTTNADLCVSVAGRKVQFSVEPIGATRDASEAILYIFPVEQLAHTGELARRHGHSLRFSHFPSPSIQKRPLEWGQCA